MGREPHSAADKFIVDRRKPHRNSDVARAVRKTRDRLSHQAGSPAFDGDMLKIHGRAIISSAPAILFLLAVMAAFGVLIDLPVQAAIWLVPTAGSYLGLYLLSRHLDRLDQDAMDVRRLRRRFLMLHFVGGVGWAYFVSLRCVECGLPDVSTLLAIMLLLVMAATALIAASLRGAILATFAFPVGAYAFYHAQPSLTVETIMALVLGASLPFFTYVAHQRNEATLRLLAFRSEKDGLIAELETAKAMSDEARRRAEEANLAKSRFLASMSHELRTPLNAILGFSEVMAKEVLGPIENDTYRDYASDVHESGKHLLALINEILDLSRIEAGRYQLNEEPVILSDVVVESARMMNLKLKAKDIRLLEQMEHSLPRLFADERAIRQITLNLLSNAVKFTPSGGQIRLSVGWTAGGGQYLSVRDNGPGIAEDEIPIVLSAFGQGTIAIKSAEEGAGLGLPIVQGLAELHGGKLYLKSRLREGTEAVVTFPSSRVMEELPAMPAEMHQRQKHARIA
ncbi:sensor histidine kinase [Nitratireductor basaltis]|uniref:histidine kinase n=1 Tax=Nitratireductor basaltis TaxID=472175 RepID=A0A084UAY6_9HYPH|nr:HAMP domain-containing sensor histidine kinase [Nitratireductor basaltis]KFB10122.1 Periplasmic sensor signal transduction histidine kinase [Nitratireductor basaltis]